MKREVVVMTKYLALIFNLGFLSLGVSDLKAATITALSSSLSDVNTAVAQAVDGDTVFIPAGSATWAGTLSITKAIAVVGAGINSTIISGNGHSLVTLQPAIGQSARLSGIRFNINAYNSAGGNYPIDVEDGGVTRIDHCWFEEGQYVVTYTANYSGNTFGLIDHCTFHNHDNGVQLNGNRHTWELPIVPGTLNTLVIEDNVFIADKVGNGDNNECIMSGHGVRFVVRHSTFDGTAFNDNFMPYENHGQGDPYTGTDTDLRGPPIFEIYENVMKAKHTYRFINIRGGSGLVFNNTLESSDGFGDPIQLTEDQELRLPPQFTTWAGEDQINNSFFWNNTFNGAPISQIVLYDPSLITFIQEGRDYWMHAPDATSGKTIWTDRPGSHNEQFVAGAQAYYPYTPLVYPHPYITDCVNYPLLCDSTSKSGPSGGSTSSQTQTQFLPFKNVFVPSKETLRVRFSIVGTGVSLVVCDRFGHTIRTLDTANGSTADWDGRNESGTLVASGSYLCLLKQGKTTVKRTVVVVK